MLMQTTLRALLLTILFSYPLLHCALRGQTGVQALVHSRCRLPCLPPFLQAPNLSFLFILPTPCQMRDDRLTEGSELHTP